MTMTSSPISDHEVQLAAWNLREAGYTYKQIAVALGLATSNIAFSAVKARGRRLGLPIPGRSARRAEAARQGAETRYTDAAGTRRFGVEIEVSGIDLMQAYEAIRTVVRCANPGGNNNYTHTIVEGEWKVVYDGSVEGAEVVSPPLCGADGEAQLKAVMKALKAAGGRVNRSCGLHVHHEVIDLTGDELAALLRIYARHQGTMDALVAPSRRNAFYTRHFGTSEVERMAESFIEAGQQVRSHGDGLRRAVEARGFGGRHAGTRYRVLNVHSFPLYGTMEFRQHQGTLNGSKAVAWVRLGQAMVSAAQAAADLDGIDGADFLQALRSHGLQTRTVRFLSARIDQLAAV